MNRITLTALALMMTAAPVLARDTAAPLPSGAMTQTAFADIDTDGDGRITLAEWTDFLSRNREARRMRMIATRVDALFDAAEAAPDAALTREQLAAAFDALHQTRQGMHGEGARRPLRAGRAEGMHPGMDRGGMRHMGRMGPRHLGAGTGDATDVRAERSFSRIDRDGDGAISPEELAAAQARWQQRAERRAERVGHGHGRHHGRGHGHGRGGPAD